METSALLSAFNDMRLSLNSLLLKLDVLEDAAKASKVTSRKQLLDLTIETGLRRVCWLSSAPRTYSPDHRIGAALECVLGIQRPKRPSSLDFSAPKRQIFGVRQASAGIRRAFAGHGWTNAGPSACPFPWSRVLREVVIRRPKTSGTRTNGVRFSQKNCMGL